MKGRSWGVGIAAFLAVSLVWIPAAAAAPFTATPPVEASGTSPFTGCTTPLGPGPGMVFTNGEVEPWVDANPANPDNLVGFYQQDRWSNGGAKSNLATVSMDGGASWTQVVVPVGTICSDSGGYERASDPWVTFSPNGVVHAMSLVTDSDPPAGFGDNGMSYNRSTDGGLTWEDPIFLIEDTNPRVLNDKNSITADPNDSRFVYAVWDRLQTPAAETHLRSAENRPGPGFKGPIYFARTTNGGSSWEPARRIYETGANKQTLGNQIVVEPAATGGSLFDFFGDITNASERRKIFGPVGVSYVRSDDRGATWTKPIKVADQLPMSLFRASSTIDPESPPAPCPTPDAQGNCPIRTGDLLPEVAVNRTNGNLYVVWMDARFDAFQNDAIAFSQSTNGGASWSAPIKVNATPDTEPVGDQQAFTPSVHVADNGTVSVSYYDFRNNTADAGTLLTDHFAVHCHAAVESCTSPASWNEETRITPTSLNIREAPFARGYFLGDYVGLTATDESGDPDGPKNDFLSLFGSTKGIGPSSIFSSRLSG
jgi:hypothetical protein